MEFTDIIGLGVTAIGSVFTGGLTGLIGTGLSLWGDHKKREQDLEVRRIDNAHDLAVMDKEWAGRTEVAGIEGEAAMNVSADNAFASSFTSEPKRYLAVKGSEMPWLIKFLLGVVDFLRGFIRPGMTIYLVVLITAIYWDLRVLMDTYGITMTPDQVLTLMHMIISTVLYTGTTALLWWFGTRNKQQPPRSS